MSTKTARPKSRRIQPWGKTVKVEFENGIAWVVFNRPEKRNAFSAELAFEMMDVLDSLEADDRCGVLVFTGAGEAWSAGMDLKDYFRATDNAPPAVRARVYRARTGAGSGAGCFTTPSRPSQW
jgi:feruloyl-CoA hydratase/lyase